MSRPLPHIRQHSPPKNDSVPKKRVHRSSSIEMNPTKVRLNKLVESRLAKQFVYFRAEFLEHALSIGIPVPLDMVEEKNGKVMAFVNQKGPRYLLNIIHAYPESVHLLRSSLSFLIVIIAILTRKIAEAKDNERRLPHAQNVELWATEALNSIADSSSVAICTNLLRHSHSEAIQELILSLLAQLVNVSSEAAAQMLHRPNVSAAASTDSNHQNNLDSSGSSNPATPRENSASTVVPNGRSNDPDDMTCLSYMFSVVSHNRNRYTVMTSCAEVCLALLKDKSRIVSETMARTWISQQPLKPGDVDTKARYSVIDEKIVKKHKKEKHAKGKPLAVLTRKPPTTALARGATKSKSQLSNDTQKDDAAQRRMREEAELNDNPNEWAALKVLLKFLHRFMRYGVGDSSRPVLDPSLVDDDESLSQASSRQSKGKARFQDTTSGLGTDDIVPHKHKKALYTAHSRVLLVVCEFVNNSPAVAKYILSMPGACSIMKASCELHKSTDIGDMVMSCLAKLQGETEILFKKALTTNHSMSFELTHGKSAKLFNPVSPIARRETAMLSPERVRNIEVEANVVQSATFTMSCGADNGDIYTRPKSRGTSNFAKSSNREDSRPASRSGLIPLDRLFSSEAKRYDEIEEEKRRQELEKKVLQDAFNEYDEEQEDGEREFLERDDSWFLDSFEHSDEMKRQQAARKKTRRKRPPAIQTSFDGESASRPSPSQRPVSSLQRSPVPPYNPPESPVRRGLGPHNGGIKGKKDPNESLHRSLFTNLPELPDMPVRLEADAIINDSNEQKKEELLCRSMSMTSTVVDVAYKDGFYKDGKNNIPISERARRVYVPEMVPFHGEADRHPNFITEEYLEEVRNRPKSQGSVMNERSARIRAATKRRAAKNAQHRSKPSSPTMGNQESFDEAFSDYYQGLLPLNGVGEVEPESEFQLFLVQKQQAESQRASTAPSTLGQRKGRGERERVRGVEDDSMTFEDSTIYEDTSGRGYASYASSLSRDETDIGAQDSQCDDSLVVDWNQDEETRSRPTTAQEKSAGQIVQSVDILFP